VQIRPQPPRFSGAERGQSRARSPTGRAQGLAPAAPLAADRPHGPNPAPRLASAPYAPRQARLGHGARRALADAHRTHPYIRGSPNRRARPIIPSATSRCGFWQRSHRCLARRNDRGGAPTAHMMGRSMGSLFACPTNPRFSAVFCGLVRRRYPPAPRLPGRRRCLCVQRRAQALRPSRQRPGVGCTPLPYYRRVSSLLFPSHTAGLGNTWPGPGGGTGRARSRGMVGPTIPSWGVARGHPTVERAKARRPRSER
jgi:hypothetical protein